MTTIRTFHASCLDWLAEYDGPLFDCCVTDPPYHLSSIVKRFGGKNAAEAKVGATGAYARASRGFMGKEWDGGDVAFRPETWAAILAVMKPGAHLVAFSGTRTYHRMACAIEDAGFEIRDQLMWCYGTGFPKSHDVSKGIDKHNGHERPVVGTETLTNDIRGGGLLDVHHGENRPAFERNVTISASSESEQWEGWGTALKPALEPICLARKPLSEKSVAANVLKHGTGAINIDACRVQTDEQLREGAGKLWSHYREGEASAERTYADKGATDFAMKPGPRGGDQKGRFPANLLHDGSDEVIGAFPEAPGALYAVTGEEPSSPFAHIYGRMPFRNGSSVPRGDEGTAARFFYSAKAGPLDRIGTAHATVKTVDCMRWLVRMVTPPGGHILEPFAGSGTTGIAAMAEGFDCTMIEMDAEHVADIERKLAYLRGEGGTTFEEHNHAKRLKEKPQPIGGLFGDAL